MKGVSGPVQMFDGKLRLPALKLPPGINTGRAAMLSPSATEMSTD